MRQIIYCTILLKLVVLLYSCSKISNRPLYRSIPLYNIKDSMPIKSRTYKVWWETPGGLNSKGYVVELVTTNGNGEIVIKDINGSLFLVNKDQDWSPSYTGDYILKANTLIPIDPKDFLDTIYYYPVFINP